MTDLSPGDRDASTWDSQLSTMFLDLVDSVRDKTSGPALRIARALVYGLVIIVALIALAVLSLILLVRIANFLPWSVWFAYLLLGLVFFAAGSFLWSKRRP